MSYLSNYVYRSEKNGSLQYYVIPEPEAKHILGSQDAIRYHEFFTDTDHIIDNKATKYTLE